MTLRDRCLSRRLRDWHDATAAHVAEKLPHEMGSLGVRLGKWSAAHDCSLLKSAARASLAWTPLPRYMIVALDAEEGAIQEIKPKRGASFLDELHREPEAKGLRVQDKERPGAIAASLGEADMKGGFSKGIARRCA